MLRAVSCLAVLAVLVGVGEVAAVPLGPVIAETGFNDASGINSDGVGDSPYELDAELPGQPLSEPGWAGPWVREHSTTGTTMVQSSVKFEGDGAGFLPPISNTARYWTTPQDGQFIVESRMRFNPNSSATMYVYRDEIHMTSQMFHATLWHATEDGVIEVLDGIGDGSKPMEDTGFRWVPDKWYKFTQIIDYPNHTWRFFMDDVEYLAPDALGFRGTPQPLNGINFLSIQPGSGVYIDQLRVAAIPEPSTLILLGMGAIGLLAWVWRRRKK